MSKVGRERGGGGWREDESGSEGESECPLPFTKAAGAQRKRGDYGIAIRISGSCL